MTAGRSDPSARTTVEVEGRQLALSHLDKILYPAAGFTKGQVIDYYARIAPVLLPHLRGRPLTLKRYPDGVEGKHFYEKQCPSHRPEWVRTARVPSSGRGGRDVDHCVVDDLPTLMWAANLADLELHTSLSLGTAVETPTMVVFDLDPGSPASILECGQVALALREALAGLGLESFPKTSGAKGLQILLPLNTPVGYETSRAFALALAQLLEREHPALVVSRMTKSARRGKVFVDWSQNARHKTTICAYSLRATERPRVSTPVTWEELEQSVASGVPLGFDPAEAIERSETLGDLLAPVLRLEQRLPARTPTEANRGAR